MNFILMENENGIKYLLVWVVVTTDSNEANEIIIEQNKKKTQK